MTAMDPPCYGEGLLLGQWAVTVKISPVFSKIIVQMLLAFFASLWYIIGVTRLLTKIAMVPWIFPETTPVLSGCGVTAIGAVLFGASALIDALIT